MATMDGPLALLAVGLLVEATRNQLRRVAHVTRSLASTIAG
jgi:hypothetical protein